MKSWPTTKTCRQGESGLKKLCRQGRCLIGPFKEVIGRSWACLGSAWLEPSSKPSLDTCIHLHLGYLRFHLEYLHSPSPSIFSLPSPGPLLTYIALTSIAYTMHFSLRLPSLPSHCPWMGRYMLHHMGPGSIKGPGPVRAQAL